MGCVVGVAKPWVTRLGLKTASNSKVAMAQVKVRVPETSILANGTLGVLGHLACLAKTG